jgi:hypothetical protein
LQISDWLAADNPNYSGLWSAAHPSNPQSEICNLKSAI